MEVNSLRGNNNRPVRETGRCCWKSKFPRETASCALQDARGELGELESECFDVCVRWTESDECFEDLAVLKYENGWDGRDAELRGE